ncbi:hypothetical protein MOF38_00120 [Bacillus haynesii]|uniref:hypothetical protein n=1 Tax=Bacillus haynesii TaxID=1925021 RepID=UPI0022813E52|nr:hypothetical protein [Bacillus haynesii]MCY8009442.1 hypothetical protein [Bacillus haynesii]MCY8755062.1 hypothetical protein [Bacillus haynesii]MCY9274862.1 hypothetical protein [Bacillus haynesii]MCY9398200.1 hypothetical protein [Bacillus haynesii]MEC0707577.1 hypothetical protein [Bacillus haynesii]
MPCSNMYDIYVLKVCTDADSYSAKATSIDCVATYGGGSIATFDYLMKLEVWNGYEWKADEVKSGYFSHSTPKKVFKLSHQKLLKKGSNSCRVRLQATNRKTNAKYSIRTPAFIVKR